jgi:Transposase DDE domain group 1
MTECNQVAFDFARHFSREVKADFAGGRITSDGGALLLREVDQRLNLLNRFSDCFRDLRNPDYIRHPLAEMIRQRVYGLALGYEDLNDHEQLREDPMMALLAGQKEIGEDPLAGKSTLNRLELSGKEADRYKKIVYDEKAMDDLLVDVFLEAYPEAPERLVLDVDVTDVTLHGHQEGRFFHGFYDSYCYLPLFIFCGEHLLGARLREANRGASVGCREELERIVGRIRKRWPNTEIVIRGDSAFCREELMHWCEQQEKVQFVFGFARNPKLRERIASEMAEATRRAQESKQPARVFAELIYQTESGSWSRARRVVAKAEYLDDKENPRFVATSLPIDSWPAQKLYEEMYCARGEMENCIKEQFFLFADRLSTETLRANQLRMYFSALGYVLMQALRRLGLQGTELAQAQCSTIRLKLLKIGALIGISVRRVHLMFSSGYPYQDLFRRIYLQLQAIPLRA